MVTEGGLELDCDMVVVGAGVMPDVMLAKSAGLDLGESGGVLCSPGLATSVDGVFAAGDMCEYDSVVHGRPLRVEHVEAARAQGATAARSMLGQGVRHEEVPLFYSDLADWVSFEYVGPGSGEPTIRGSLDDGELHGVLPGGRPGDGGPVGGPRRSDLEAREARASPRARAPDPSRWPTRART